MHRSNARNAGFTLTELLVASAIFLILMTALVTLFNAAVSSMRQGYASIDAYENGRQANMVLSRDLTASFNSREHGDVYNFYGRHDGFMFVGALDNGQIGRVTYVTHPTLGTRPARTTIRERWGVVEAAIRRQATRVAREMGMAGTTVGSQVDGLIDVVDDFYFYSDTSGTRRYNAEEWVEFDVELTVENLIRYEESGANDLNTFDMYVKLDGVGAPITLDWPYVDPLDPARDATPVAATDGDYQQRFLLEALDPTPGDLQYDLRVLFNNINTGGGWQHPVTLDRLYVRALGRDVFDQLLQSRKREFWLRMLSGDPMGIPSLAPNDLYGSVGYWYDEGSNVPNTQAMRVVNEYVVAEGIVTQAKLYQPGTDILIEILPGIPVDALDAEVQFAYGDGESAPVHYFNDIENLRNADNPDGVYNGPVVPNPYPDQVMHSIPMLLKSTGPITEGDLIEADSALADAMVGSASRLDPNNPTQAVANRALLGSPLRPRIPQVVTTDLWVTRNRTRPGAPDILKRFTQTIQIPAAHGRSVSTTVARGPGASL